MIPVVCHGCGQRGKVASIPSDLACAACLSTDVDLDDRTAAIVGDPDMPMGLLPNDQPEMNTLGEVLVTETVRCSTCFHQFSQTVTDPSAPMPKCPKCGADTVTAAGTVTAGRDGSAEATGDTFGGDRQHLANCALKEDHDGSCITKKQVADALAKGMNASSAKTAGETAAPYHVRQRGSKWVVVNDHGDVKGTHDSEEEARQQQKALYANVPGAREQAEKKSSRKVADIQGVRNSLARANGTEVVITYTTDMGVRDDAGTLAYSGGDATLATSHGSVTIRPGMILEVRQTGYGDWDAPVDPVREPTVVDYAFSGVSPAGAWASKQGAADSRKPNEIEYQRELERKPQSQLTGEEEVDLARLRQQQQGKGVTNPYTTGNPYRAAKVQQIADAVLLGNPGLGRQAALHVAEKTVARYPKVLG